MYAGLITRGVSTVEADQMEIWQVGAAFGIHRPCTVCGEPGGVGENQRCHACQSGDKPPTPANDWDPIKARIEARAAGLPGPTAPPPHVRRPKVR